MNHFHSLQRVLLMSALKPTQEQAKIINHLRGHCIVKAGPGCAKTSTLALRVKHLHILAQLEHPF